MKFRVQSTGKEVEAPVAEAISAPPAAEPPPQGVVVEALSEEPSEAPASIEEKKTRNRVVGSAHTPVLERAEGMVIDLKKLEEGFEALGQHMLTWPAVDGLLMLKLIDKQAEDRPRYWTTTLQELCFVHGEGLRPAALLKDMAEELMALANQAREIAWLFEKIVDYKAAKAARKEKSEEAPTAVETQEASSEAPAPARRRRIIPAAHTAKVTSVPAQA